MPHAVEHNNTSTTRDMMSNEQHKTIMNTALKPDADEMATSSIINNHPAVISSGATVDRGRKNYVICVWADHDVDAWIASIQCEERPKPDPTATSDKRRSKRKRSRTMLFPSHNH